MGVIGIIGGGGDIRLKHKLSAIPFYLSIVDIHAA